MTKHTIPLTLLMTTLLACSSNARPSSAEVDLPEQERSSSEPSPSVDAGTGEASTPEPAQRFELPKWSREDVQPRSARFGQRYGLEAYEGKTIVVVLLEGYCSFCQSNSVVAQRLQETLDAEKLDARIVVLGDLNAEQFASKVSLPIFRDDDGAAWDEMRPRASKHDTFVFGPDGTRTFFWLGSYQGDASRWTSEVGAAVRAVAWPTGGT